MSKLAMHVEHYKRGSIGAIEQHDLRTGATHSNEDIDPERSENNIQLLTPENGSLYATVMAAAENSAGRITSNSVLLSSWVLYPPEDLQDPQTADPEDLKRWGNDVLEWMREKKLHPQSASIHLDETTAHMHVETTPITADGRFCRKELYTRAALASYHTELAKHLAAKGWDIQRGDKRESGQKGKSKTVREYKAWAEEEKARLEQELQETQEQIQGEKARLEQELQETQEQIQGEKARLEQDLQEVQKQTADEKTRLIGESQKIEENIKAQVAAYEQNEQVLDDLDRAIEETEAWLASKPDLSAHVARTQELQRLRQAASDAEKKEKAVQEMLKQREQAIECIREDLSKRLDDYAALKERKKEAWKDLSEAEATVAALQGVLEDAGVVKGLIVRIALCGAENHAKQATERHDALCAAVRAGKHKIQAQQRALQKESAELDKLLQEGAAAAKQPQKTQERERGQER